jgi:hypothetical protein
MPSRDFGRQRVHISGPGTVRRALGAAPSSVLRVRSSMMGVHRFRHYRLTFFDFIDGANIARLMNIR